MESMKTQKLAKEWLHTFILLILSGLFFFGVGHNGYVLEPDSYNYIECNFGREPLYPMFLLLFRTIFGEGMYLWIVWIVQALVAMGTVVYSTLWFQKQFALRRWVMYVVFFLLLVPYWFVTIWFEPMSLWTNHIITEGLTFSLYYLFFVFVLKTLYRRSVKDFAFACLICVLLATMRSQMLVSLAICVPVAVILVVMQRKEVQFKRVCIGCFVTLLATGCVYFGIKTVYKYKITDTTENAGTLQLALLANLLYSADEEDVSCYEDEELQKIFLDLYGRVMEQGMNYKCAGGMMENGDLMYYSHDLIKYGVINDVYYDYIYREGLYEDRVSDMNLEEFITGMEGPLLRANFWQLIGNSMCEWPDGYIRSVFTASDSLYPLNVVYCVIIYVSAAGLCLFALLKKRWELAVPMVLAVIFNVMTIAGVALTIYVSMRYLMYNLGMFYICGMLLLLQFPKIRGVVQRTD